MRCTSDAESSRNQISWEAARSSNLVTGCEAKSSKKQRRKPGFRMLFDVYRSVRIAGPIPMDPYRVCFGSIGAPSAHDSRQGWAGLATKPAMPLVGSRVRACVRFGAGGRARTCVCVGGGRGACVRACVRERGRGAMQRGRAMQCSRGTLEARAGKTSATEPRPLRHDTSRKLPRLPSRSFQDPQSLQTRAAAFTADHHDAHGQRRPRWPLARRHDAHTPRRRASGHHGACASLLEAKRMRSSSADRREPLASSRRILCVSRIDADLVSSVHAPDRAPETRTLPWCTWQSVLMIPGMPPPHVSSQYLHLRFRMRPREFKEEDSPPFIVF